MSKKKNESDVPEVSFVFHCSSEEFRQWRDGILKGLDEIEALLRASREVKRQ